MVSEDVLLQHDLTVEDSRAGLTGKVAGSVSLKFDHVLALLAANHADQVCVHPVAFAVSIEVAFLGEIFVTDVACEWFFRD